jgi:hypothetical protein
MKSRDRRIALAAALIYTSALFALLSHSPAVHGAQPGAVLAEFRGCESVRTCRFQIESSTPSIKSLLVVRPNGVSTEMYDDATAMAVRNRLNSLMSSMIHQHKRIELEDLRKLDDGTYAATVKVDGMDVSEDATLNDLVGTSKNEKLSF